MSIVASTLIKENDRLHTLANDLRRELSSARDLIDGIGSQKFRIRLRRMDELLERAKQELSK